MRRYLRASGLIALLFLCFIAIVPLSGQSAKDTATDLQFHKFQPKVAPDRAIPMGANQAQTDNGMSVFAAQQMTALQQDKASRTPAQQKIDSNIIYTTRMLAGQPAAPGVQYLYTGVDLDQSDNIAVDMVANVTGRLLQKLADAGAQVLYTNRAMRSIRAIIPPSQIEGIAASQDVIFISPKQGSMTARVEPIAHNYVLRRPLSPGFEQRAANVRRQLASLLFLTGPVPITWQGSVGTEGDLTHRAFDARGAFGVNGSPLTIGVLSDGVTTLAASQATGDLPPTCNSVVNPCVEVINSQVGAGDEGTAMLEIIHDMAPGANLKFATADTSITSFAQNIRDLRTAGCDIIVDDVFYFVETPFQDGQTGAVTSTTNAGVVTQAVNDVVADGALYFSSAGNEGNLDLNTSGTFEGDFNGVASVAPLPSGKVHNFAGNPFNPVTSPGFQILGLWWTDPLGGSNNDYDLYVLDSGSTTILAASTNIQNGTQDAVELIGSGSVATNTRVVVFQNTGAADRFFHLVIFRGGLTVNTTGETHGHSAASGAYTVAATPAAATPFGGPAGPFPNPFGPANKIETFSSDGPRRVFFNGDSSAITPGNFSSTGGQLLNKPDITAADGVSVTGVGGFGSPFFGTSAAAPSAAAVAALVKSAKPSLTAMQMRTTLTSTAVDIMGAGFDRDSGAGIVMAWEAINSLGVAGSANPEISTITATENPGNGNGFIEAGEGGKLVIALNNKSGVKAATAVNATLTSSTPGVTITQPGTSAYADMAVGSAGGNNLTPFTFTLDPTFPCGLAANFTLTVNYTGGPQRVLNFNVPTGAMVTFNSTLGTLPTAIPGVTTATGTQTGRLLRTGIASTCAAPKIDPGLNTAVGSRVFNSYTFTACQSTCVSSVLTSANGISIYEAAYSPTFVPATPDTNYVADAGASSSTQNFSFGVTAGTSYTIVVHDINPTPSGSAFSLQFPSCAFNCTTNHVPIAKAHDVTVEAANTGGTGNANIDNGSSDPDGDPITLSQTPPGPYPVGVTNNVLLNVTDSKGATAQATANVTVLNPEFTLATTLSAVTVTAGQSGTEHITFTPNPGIGAPLSFNCTGLPAESSCSFSPSPVPAGSAATDVVLTISTTAPTAALAHPQAFYAAWMPFAGLGLVGLVLLGAPASKKSRRRKAAMLLMTLFVMGALTLLAGCGGSSHKVTDPGTPKGTFPVTVTGTSGNVSHNASFNLTVQ